MNHAIVSSTAYWDLACLMYKLNVKLPWRVRHEVIMLLAREQNGMTRYGRYPFTLSAQVPLNIT